MNTNDIDTAIKILIVEYNILYKKVLMAFLKEHSVNKGAVWLSSTVGEKY